jgi:hypothetical protein
MQMSRSASIVASDRSKRLWPLCAQTAGHFQFGSCEQAPKCCRYSHQNHRVALYGIMESIQPRAVHLSHEWAKLLSEGKGSLRVQVGLPLSSKESRRYTITMVTATTQCSPLQNILIKRALRINAHLLSMSTAGQP